MINLKLSEKEKKEMYEGGPKVDDGSDYPWGTRLRFENDSVKKVPGLQKVKAGDMVDIKATGKVVEVRTTDRDGEKTYECVEIQIQKIDLGSADEAEEAFKED